VSQRPVVRVGSLAVADMVTLTLSADHRVVDGAVGAAFLNSLVGLIETPAPL
jgi:pyruvate dehydrogenase E2 component (dihydrolipoamide acetyltransferase)